MNANRHHPARAHNRGNSEPKRRQDKQFMAGKLTSRTWVLLTEAPAGGWPARRQNRGKEGDNHASLTGRSKSDRLAYTQPEYSPTLSPPCDDRHAAFSIVLVGIQIAESARPCVALAMGMSRCRSARYVDSSVSGYPCR